MQYNVNQVKPVCDVSIYISLHDGVQLYMLKTSKCWTPSPLFCNSTILCNDICSILAVTLEPIAGWCLFYVYTVESALWHAALTFKCWIGDNYMHVYYEHKPDTWKMKSNVAHISYCAALLCHIFRNSIQ